MCGRFTLRSPASDVARAFAAVVEGDWTPRYNVAPTQNVAAIRRSAGRSERELVFLRWGLIPSWAQDPAVGNRMINARGETLASKPAFRQAFKRRRCLIPCDGFYEWQKQGRRKQPFLLSVDQGGLFGLAGLWERWERDGQAIESCTVVTTGANSLLAPLHDRMPVILPFETHDLWLDPAVEDAASIEPLLRPFPAERMQARPVSTDINNPGNDTPACLDKAQRTFGW